MVLTPKMPGKLGMKISPELKKQMDAAAKERGLDNTKAQIPEKVEAQNPLASMEQRNIRGDKNPEMIIPPGAEAVPQMQIQKAKGNERKVVLGMPAVQVEGVDIGEAQEFTPTETEETPQTAPAKAAKTPVMYQPGPSKPVQRKNPVMHQPPQDPRKSVGPTGIPAIQI